MRTIGRIPNLGEYMKRFLFLAFAILFINGCASDIVSPNASNDEDANAQEGIVAPLKDFNESQVKLTIDPQSLEIKEFCSSPDICKFRQRCGKTKLIIKNDSKYNIQLTGVAVQRLSRGGNVLREGNMDWTSQDLFVKANTEKIITQKNKCDCKAGDKLCSKEYPHTASPFTVGTVERVAMKYSINKNVFETNSEATYSIVR